MATPTRWDASTWMSIQDVAEELSVPLATVYKWSAAGPGSGRFPEYRKLPNGRIRVRRDWFEEWVDSLGPAA